MSGMTHRLIALGLLAVAAVATPTAAQVTKNTPPPSTAGPKRRRQR